MIAGKKVGTKTILVNEKIKQNKYADFIMKNLDEVLIHFENLHKLQQNKK
jgi:hypothetical protein